jgi:hypothetical protein
MTVRESRPPDIVSVGKAKMTEKTNNYKNVLLVIYQEKKSGALAATR